MEESRSFKSEQRNEEKQSENANPDRGFTDSELQTCLKVLNSFKEGNRIELLQQKSYKSLRGAGLIFVEGITNKYFRGKSVSNYQKNQQRRENRKLRILQEKQKLEEDKKLLSRSKIRKKKLQHLEKFISSHSNINTDETAAVKIRVPTSDEPNALLLTKNDKDEELPDEESEPMEVQTPQKDDDTDSLLTNPESCYSCKAMYWKVHHHYDRLCPGCASLNWTKRLQGGSLKGRVALVTGARVKIGYETALILLRNNCFVIATSRFPHDTAIRFSKEKDYSVWKHNIHVYGIDLRYLKEIQTFTDYINQNYNRLDMIIHNAAQTIRRPPAFYAHLIPTESLEVRLLPTEVQPLVKSYHPQGSLSPHSSLLLFGLDESAKTEVENTETQKPSVITPTSTSAALSQVQLMRGDDWTDPRIFPPGVYDEHGQQVDLRYKNSWVLEHDQVDPVELAEVHAINSMAPYIINSNLLNLMKQTPAEDKFIINVSASEGLFYQHKTSRHPHTNMAKASMNMMTRTSADYFAKWSIWMNSVDTGWISDMNPVRRSLNIAQKNAEYFRNPLDEIDGAARILDPIFTRLKSKREAAVFGRIFKDYEVHPW